MAKDEHNINNIHITRHPVGRPGVPCFPHSFPVRAQSQDTTWICRLNTSLKASETSVSSWKRDWRMRHCC